MKMFFAAVAAAVAAVGCDCGHEHGGSCAKGHRHEGGHHDGCAERHGKNGGHEAECNEGHDHGHDHRKDHHGHEHGHGNQHEMKSVKVTEAVQRVMGLETVRSQKRSLSSTFTCPGRFELSPDARTAAATPVAGRLTLLVRPLAKVSKGDALFSVTSPELVARSREISVIEKRLAVYDEIKTRNAALENELAVKKSERAAMIAQAEEKDGVVTVRSDVDAVVESFAAENGVWLETGAAALRLVRPSALRFKAMVAAKDALTLKDGLKAEVAGCSGEIRLGVGDDSGLVPVYVVFDRDVDAVAGARAEMTVTADVSCPAQIAVPSKSIVDIRLQPTVFIKDKHDPEAFIAVAVTPLGKGGGWTAVEGLPGDDVEVVTAGAYELKLALPGAESKSSGHFHADGTFHEGEH